MVSSNPPGGRQSDDGSRRAGAIPPRRGQRPGMEASSASQTGTPAVVMPASLGSSLPRGSTPALRLVGAATAMPAPAVLQHVGQPIASASDPRWVLALRVAESLQGTIITPEKRQSLVRLGKVMGLTAFDANLVIAIVQDQARRGYAADYCPTAGEQQLRMVPLPRSAKLRGRVSARRALMAAITIAAILASEIVFFRWWLGN